jgi:hypothetical protein
MSEHVSKVNAPNLLRLCINFLTYPQPWQLLAFVLLPHSPGRSKGWGCLDNKVLMKIFGLKWDRDISGLQETIKWAASRPVLLNRQYLGEPIMKNQMGGVYSTKGESRCAYRVLVWNLGERDHLDLLEIGWWVHWWGAWTGLIWLRIGAVCSCEHSNKPVGSITCS